MNRRAGISTALGMPYGNRTPSKAFVLLHEGRRGTDLKHFTSRLPVGPTGVIVAADLTDQHRALLLFLQVVVEPDDYIILRELPTPETYE